MDRISWTAIRMFDDSLSAVIYEPRLPEYLREYREYGYVERDGFHLVAEVDDELINVEGEDFDQDRIDWTGYVEDRLYTTAEAAELLGVSRDRVIDLCNAGRMGQKVGRDWVISAADIRANQVRRSGRPKRFALHDWTGDSDVMCPIRREQDLTDGAVLLHVQHPEAGLVAVIAYPDGAQFTPSDWQGEQPQDAGDIARWRWVDEDGRDAVMFEGMPRKFAG